MPYYWQENPNQLHIPLSDRLVRIEAWIDWFMEKRLARWVHNGVNRVRREPYREEDTRPIPQERE